MKNKKKKRKSPSRWRKVRYERPGSKSSFTSERKSEKNHGTEAGGALDLIKRESIFFFPRHFLRRADIHGEGIGTRAVTSPSGLFPLTVTLWFRFQNSQESRCKYWATRSSVHSFVCTAHSFATSAQLALLAHSQTRGTVNH